MDVFSGDHRMPKNHVKAFWKFGCWNLKYWVWVFGLGFWFGQTFYTGEK